MKKSELKKIVKEVITESYNKPDMKPVEEAIKKYADDLAVYYYESAGHRMTAIRNFEANMNVLEKVGKKAIEERLDQLDDYYDGD